MQSLTALALTPSILLAGLILWRRNLWVARALGLYLCIIGSVLGWGLVLFWQDPGHLLGVIVAPIVAIMALDSALTFKLWLVLGSFATGLGLQCCAGPFQNWSRAASAAAIGTVLAIIGLVLETERTTMRIGTAADRLGATIRHQRSLLETMRQEVGFSNGSPGQYHATAATENTRYYWSYREGVFLPVAPP